MKAETIRCQHVNDDEGTVCNNIIAKVTETEIIVKRHGREIHISKGQCITIKCERCGGVTKIGG